MPRLIVVSARILLGLVLVAVTVLSLRPTGPAMPGNKDKIAHALAYASIASLLVLSRRTRTVGLRHALLVIALATAYGVGIEIVQRFVGRDFDLMDMVANAFGAAIGAAIAVTISRRIPRVERPMP
jgi:VanZ family protein